MLTLNEADDVAECVRSVTRASEILLLDSGSTDDTVARACQAVTSIPLRMEVHPFVNYSAQRNAALKLVRTPWVLFLDADERLNPALEDEIERILQNPAADAYWIPRKNVLLGRWMRHTGWYPDEQLRLLRTASVGYDAARPVHEVAEVQGNIGHLDHHLVHINYRSVGEFVEKQRTFAAFESQEMLRSGRPRMRALVGQPLRELMRRYVSLQGYRDGWRGLVFSLLLAHAKQQSIQLARRQIGPFPVERSRTKAAARIGLLSDPGGAGRAAAAVSVVIVSWNVRELLLQCLESVERELDTGVADVWVVDNGSTDGSADAVADRYPRVRLIKNDQNPGFPTANNQALRRCTEDAALLINPDAALLPGSLEALARRLRSDPAVGVVGPMLLNPDGSVQSSRRRFPSLRTGLFESTIVQRYLPSAPAIRRYYVGDLPDSVAQEVDWVHGACFLVRRAAWENVGLLDPGFHMYSEELDWQRRIKGAGWKVVFEPAARVVHHGGQSSSQVSLATHIRFHASKYRYARRYLGWAAASFLRWSILLMHLEQFWEEVAKLAIGHKPKLRRTRLGLLARVIAWHLGMPL